MNVKEKVLMCLKFAAVLAFWIVSRYYTVDCAVRDLVPYIMIGLALLLSRFNINKVAYAVVFAAASASGFALGLSEALMFIPLILYPLLELLRSSGEKKAQRAADHLSVAIMLAYPVGLTIATIPVIKSRALLDRLAVSAGTDDITALCFVVLTAALIYFVRVRSLSGKKNDARPVSLRYAYLLVTFVSAAIYAKIDLAEACSVIISDMYLALVFVEDIVPELGRSKEMRAAGRSKTR